MVKLLRLQGDSDQSSTEIRNVFSEGILIPPNSKIGLRSCRVNFLNIEDLEIYRLTADSLRTFTIGMGSVPVIPVTVPAGDYTNVNALLTAVQKANNSNWTKATIETIGNPSNYRGCHARWGIQQDRTNLVFFRLPTVPANFSQASGVIQFKSVGLVGSLTGMTLANGSIVSAGSNTENFDLRGQYSTPLINQSFSCALTTVNTTGSLEINGKIKNAASTNTAIPWGFAIEDEGGTHRYKLRVNNITHTATDVVPTDGDLMRITKHGKNITFAITRGTPETRVVLFQSGVIPTMPVAPAGAIPYLGDDELTPQIMVWNVKASAGTDFAIDTCDYQALLPGNLGNRITTTFTLPRGEPLGNMLGFTDAVYNATGAPAVTVSDQPPLGRASYPGIMVRIAAPGLDLETYAGQQDKQNQSLSFLDVIVPQSIDAVSNLIYEPNNMAMLDLKNVNPIELRNANIQFARDDTGQPLKFTGQPMVMLVIDTSN